MMNKGMKTLQKEAPEVAKKMGYSKGGMHKMPDGTMMKGAKHGYSYGGTVKKMNKGGYCGASNPASRPVKKFSCGGMVHKGKK